MRSAHRCRQATSSRQMAKTHAVKVHPPMVWGNGPFRIRLTRGASSGIGFHLVRRCAASGFHPVVVVDRHLDGRANDFLMESARVSIVRALLATQQGTHDLYQAIGGRSRWMPRAGDAAKLPTGGDLTFGADYPVRTLGLTLDLCFLRSGGLPSWQSFQSVV
jgi:hypothetical protein